MEVAADAVVASDWHTASGYPLSGGWLRAAFGRI